VDVASTDIRCREPHVKKKNLLDVTILKCVHGSVRKYYQPLTKDASNPLDLPGAKRRAKSYAPLNSKILHSSDLC
jgi:hypothetical protein